MTSWSILPQTRAGVVSLDECTSEESRGLRLHCAALDRAVAVSRMSGWRIRRLDWEVIEIDLGGGFEKDSTGVDKVPIALK
jgi:hypothetical protein